MRKKYKQPKKSLTTSRTLPDLYGFNKTKKKKSKKKKGKHLKAKKDPWAELEAAQEEARLYEEAKKAIEGMPTPFTYGSYEEAFLAGNPYEEDSEEHMKAKRKDRLRANTMTGPPSIEQMMAGPRAALESPNSVMALAQKKNPLGTAMMFEEISKNYPQDWERYKSMYPGIAGKHQRDKEARMMKGMKKSDMSYDDIMKIQRDGAVLDKIKNNLSNAKQGMMYGGKKKYNMAGMLPGAVQGVMGTAAMANQGGFQDLPWQHQVGRVMQGASGLANLIPGVGPLVGMGINLAGGALQTFGGPKMTDPARINSNPMGMMHGGQKPNVGNQVPGGQMNSLSNNGVEVKANNPNMRDSVDAGDVMLDDKEVVVGDKVFSNALKSPQNNMSFAELEKQTQKAQGMFEKYKVATGDSEMKDAKHHAKNTQMLFNEQENIATSLGLREADGTPKQMQGDNPGFYFGGSKKKMATGGSIGFYKSGTQGGFFASEGYFTGGPINGIGPSAINAQFDPRYAQTPGMQGSYPIPSGQLQPITTIGLTNYTEPPRYPNTIKDPNVTIQGGLSVGSNTGTSTPEPRISGLTMPSGTGNTMANFSGQPMSTPLSLGPQFNTGINMPQGNLASTVPQRNLRTNQLGTVSSSGITPNSGLSNQSPTVEGFNTQGSSDSTTSSPDNMQQLLEAFKGQNPFGEQATQLGNAITGLGLAANRPFYVNYGDVGREEVNQQNIGLQRARGGEQAAVNDVLAQAKAARINAGGRSFQTMQANLSNIGTRTGNALAKVRGQFGRQEAALRTQIGARRTGIEQQNLNTRRYQNDINTREYDSLWKENLKNMTNLRNMKIEQQQAFNRFRKDQELMQLLKTQDFEYGPNGELVFKQRKANIAGRTGDKTNNSVPSPTGGFSYPTHGLSTGVTGAARQSFSSQYSNPVLGFAPYSFSPLFHNGVKTK